jgi:hypothetical protein
MVLVIEGQKKVPLCFEDPDAPPHQAGPPASVSIAVFSASCAAEAPATQADDQHA